MQRSQIVIAWAGLGGLQAGTLRREALAAAAVLSGPGPAGALREPFGAIPPA